MSNVELIMIATLLVILGCIVTVLAIFMTKYYKDVVALERAKRKEIEEQKKLTLAKINGAKSEFDSFVKRYTK